MSEDPKKKKEQELREKFGAKHPRKLAQERAEKDNEEKGRFAQRVAQGRIEEGNSKKRGRQ